MATVTFHGGRAEAARLVRAILASLTGRARSEVATGVFIAVGLAALSDIHADFIRKARGQVGEDGNRWPRLSPKTLAYSRRFGTGEQAELKRAAGLGRANRFAPGGSKGLLTAAELKRWRKYFSMHVARLAATYPLEQAKSIAAGIAWNKLKAEGAKTKLMVFGNREHEALRDTGVLANSLSVGTVVGDRSYFPPRSEGGEEQIFSLQENGVIVGTNVAYAAVHNYGDEKRGIPKRQFIPEENQIPQAWLDRWLAAGMRALAFGLEWSLIRGGAA